MKVNTQHFHYVSPYLFEIAYNVLSLDKLYILTLTIRFLGHRGH